MDRILAARLAQELRMLLEDTSYARAAEKVAEELRGVDGAAAAAECLIGELPNRAHESLAPAPT